MHIHTIKVDLVLIFVLLISLSASFQAFKTTKNTVIGNKLTTLIRTGRSLTLQNWPNQQSKPTSLLNLPDVRQATDYTCGPSSLQAVLMYYGIQQREDTLSEMTQADPEEGTNVQNIKQVLNAYGLRTSQKNNMSIIELQNYINRGVPVIVLIQAWRQDQSIPWQNDWEDGHYVVVIGYDDKNLFFQDPSILGGIGYIPKAQFIERWHDYQIRDGKKNFYVQFGMAVQGTKQNIQPVVYIE